MMQMENDMQSARVPPGCARRGVRAVGYHVTLTAKARGVTAADYTLSWKKLAN